MRKQKTLVVNEKDPEMLELMKMEIAEAEEKNSSTGRRAQNRSFAKRSNDEKKYYSRSSRRCWW